MRFSIRLFDGLPVHSRALGHTFVHADPTLSQQSQTPQLVYIFSLPPDGRLCATLLY
jgi:hypothetical protein